MGYISQLIVQTKTWSLELAGTFILVATSTSALVTLNMSGQATTAAVMLTAIVATALPYAWLIYIYQQRLQGYFNPAVTGWLWVSSKLSASQAISLIIAQLAGAILASIAVAVLYGPLAVEAGLGSVNPNSVMGPWSAAIAEAIGTLCLLLAMARLQKNTMYAAKSALLIGVSMAVGQLIAIGISGAALNPARAIAPQLAAATLQGWWVYWVGPILAIALVWVADHYITAGVEQSKIIQPTPIKAVAPSQPTQPTTKPTQPPLESQESQPTKPQITKTTRRPSFQSEDAIETEAKPDHIQPEQPEVAPEAKQRTTVPAPTTVKFVNFDQPAESTPAPPED